MLAARAVQQAEYVESYASSFGEVVCGYEHPLQQHICDCSKRADVTILTANTLNICLKLQQAAKTCEMSCGKHADAQVLWWCKPSI